MTTTSTPTLARICRPELADFGKELLAAGFRVWVFASDVERVAKGGLESCARSIRFSRVVDGRECFGSVDHSVAGYQFHMPIKPSRENGSSMFVSPGDETPEFEPLDVAKAELYASPTGYNRLVGRQENYESSFAHRLYTEVFG